jgi:hypothetical protein
VWKCLKCDRIFEKANQPHSCHKVPLETHFKNKDKAKELFDCLVGRINSEIGKYQIISIPCCIHFFGKYDFLAVLPKRNGLEIRFALDRQLKSPRLTQSVPLSAKAVKNCLDIKTESEIDEEFIGWLSQSYHLKDKT